MPAHRVQPPCSEEGSPWAAKVSVQCTHALQLVFSEHTLCSSLRSEHASEELRCRRWGTHRWRAARQADHACTIAKTRAANIAASSATKKGGMQGRSGPSAYRTTFSNIRPESWTKMGETSGGVKHGPTGRLAEHLAPQALRWPTRWPTPEICCFPHRAWGPRPAGRYIDPALFLLKRSRRLSALDLRVSKHSTQTPWGHHLYRMFSFELTRSSQIDAFTRLGTHHCPGGS